MKTNKWISVKDTIPAINGTVLLNLAGYGNYFVAKFT